jgi:hypothetical protein
MFRSLLSIVGFLVFGMSFIHSQEVIVSEKINIRSDYAYEILGNIGQNILLYRDKGIDHKIVAFEDNLSYKWERKLKFDKNKVEVFSLVPVDTAFFVFFGFRKDGFDYIKANLYDETTSLISEDTLLVQEENLKLGRFNTLLSEDNSKIVLYDFEKNNKIRLLAYDIENSKLICDQEYLIEKLNWNRDLVDMILTDNGETILLLEKNDRRYKKEDHVAEVIILEPAIKNARLSILSLEGVYVHDMLLSVDNQNRRLGVAGLYSDRDSKTATGYFNFNKKLSYLNPGEEFTYHSFKNDFIKEVYGKQAEKKKGLEDHLVHEIIWRRDGGMLVLTEMNKMYSRRSSYNGAGTYNAGYAGVRGWMDFYNQDIVVIGIHPTGEEHWKQVLYKKQFSQDDDGIYSSFFLFKTPSRLRLIFNDEIKKENTVSEYIMAPNGLFNRSSLLSTDYQKLKLRFRDALQISSSEIIVPSERNNNLSLVKIRYI